jgi:Ca2+-binding EF-hand superfamily protein
MKTRNTILHAILIAAIGLAGISNLAVAEDAKKRAYFDKFDADGDGQLSGDEFSAMVTKQFTSKGKEVPEGEAEKRFNRKDTDADGFMSFDEFMYNKKKM